MILRLFALTLALAAALLSYEFFLSFLVAGSHIYMHAKLLYRMLPSTAGIILAVVAMWRLRRKSLPFMARGAKKAGNST